MYKKENNFFDRPTKQQLIVAGILSFIGIVTSLYFASYSFTINPFQKKSVLAVVIFFMISIFIYKLYNNYKVKGRK